MANKQTIADIWGVLYADDYIKLRIQASQVAQVKKLLTRYKHKMTTGLEDDGRLSYTIIPLDESTEVDLEVRLIYPGDQELDVEVIL